ncbi:MAG TPA: hypothetical protein ENO30_02825, partial [Thermodesulfobium narugense]|nr:hypothetical protein [Thermodesulfobium narugense]
MRVKFVVFSLFLVFSFSYSDELQSMIEEYNYNCRPVPSDFYSDSQRGWFYKEYCEKLKQEIDNLSSKRSKDNGKKQEKVESKKVVNYSKIVDPSEKVKVLKDNLDNADFWSNTVYPWKWLKDEEVLRRIDQKTFKEIVDRVVYYSSLDYQNEEKMSTAVYIVNYTRERSYDFAKGYVGYILKNPEYNIVSRGGYNSWSYRTVSSIKDNKILDYINRRISNIGLVFFADPDCPYCREQVSAFRFLKEKLPNLYIRVMVADRGGCSYYMSLGVFSECSVDPSAFQRFNVEILPTTFIYYNSSKGKFFDPIAAGLYDAESLKYAIMSYIYKV